MKASIKRLLQVWATLKLTDYIRNWEKKETNRIWVPRKIIHRQSNAIRFEGGSWLYFNITKAGDTDHTEKWFEIRDYHERYKEGKEPCLILKYEIL